MKLFAIYVGGAHPRANIELHDMRFVIAPSIEATHDQLREQWWGTADTLHIDCWAELDQVDGYDLQLKPEPYLGEEKVYYVNLGGYEAGEFIEKHRNAFVVARSLPDAKSRALRANRGWKQLHRDDLYEAEQAFCLTEVSDREQRLYIHLEPSQSKRDLRFTCKYTPLKKRPRRRD